MTCRSENRVPRANHGQKALSCDRPDWRRCCVRHAVGRCVKRGKLRLALTVREYARVLRLATCDARLAAGWAGDLRRATCDLRALVGCRLSLVACREIILTRKELEI